jgi:hypothetical protein
MINQPIVYHLLPIIIILSGGIVTFRIPQLDNNQNITIYLDNSGLKDQQITKMARQLLLIFLSHQTNIR